MKIEFLKEENKVIVDGVEYVRNDPQIEYTFDVNGHEVPEPIREEFERGCMYYVADVSSSDMYLKLIWNGDEFDKRVLARGLAHLSKENAITHAEALLSFTNGDEWAIE